MRPFSDASVDAAASNLGAIRVLQPGPFTTLQDLGRRGRGHQGIARAGAFDQRAHQLANRLVGNEIGAATIEILLGPCAFTALTDVVVAVTGTDARLTIARDVPNVIRDFTATEGSNVAFVLRGGDHLTIGVPQHGLRTYVAIRGGFDVVPILGSRSYDSLGQIGPLPLQAHDTLPVGDATGGEAWLEPVPIREPSDVEAIDIRLGPRHDWLPADARTELESHVWTIDPSSNRTGIRFAGPALARKVGELASEAMILGAVQLPLSGLPIVLGPDGGTTGGYPVIGVIAQSGIDQLAQRRPGERVRFRVQTRT
jgi:biotin-dependent carboxylase-like uncharacterized protein